MIRILKDVPSNYAIPIVIILHRKKYYKSSMNEVIQQNASITIKEVEEKEKIEPGFVYIAPADYHVLIEEDYTFSLCASELLNYSRPSIDVTFESAAEVFGPRLLGIILTGANRDGSEGLKSISEKGGATIVQDPKEAEMAEMPASALNYVKSSIVLGLDQINRFLLDL